jgi:hypothetical protein
MKYSLDSSDDDIEEHVCTLYSTFVITTNGLTIFVYDLQQSKFSPSHFNCQKSRLLANRNFKMLVTIVEQGHRLSLLLREKKLLLLHVKPKQRYGWPSLILNNIYFYLCNGPLMMLRKN